VSLFAFAAKLMELSYLRGLNAKSESEKKKVKSEKRREQ
jgi:hypothetical protein